MLDDGKVNGNSDWMISNYNRANDVAVWPCVCLVVCPFGRVCGNQLLERLMSPSPKSQVMFASAFS